MSIEIKISKKPVEYVKAVSFLEKRMLELKDKKQSELIWILEHPSTYTRGIRSKENEILDKNLKIINTNRGGKLTWHGSGQIVCYKLSVVVRDLISNNFNIFFIKFKIDFFIFDFFH